MRKFNLFLCVILFLAMGISSSAQSYVSIASGVLTDPAIWSLPWAGAPVPPTSGQPVVISAGNTVTGTTTNAWVLDVFGTLILDGDYSNTSGGLTIEDGGILIIKGNMTTGSRFDIKGSGKIMVMGNLNQTGGNITISNTGILVVGQTFTESWQTMNLYNNAQILIIQNYNVNGNMHENSPGNVITVLGTVNGGGCSGCVNSIVATDPAWIFWTTGLPNLWTGKINTNWGNTANWSGSIVPITGANIVFDVTATNDLILDQDRKVGNLTNTSSKRLVIPAAKCLTVNGSITTNNDPNQIYIKAGTVGANGSLIFHNSAASPVQASVEMYSLASYVNSHYRWQFIGIPLHSMTPSPTFDGSYIRQMHENDNPLHWEQLNNSSLLTSFTGYEITRATTNTYLFQGQLENQNYSARLPYTTSANYPGQSLIGNPYTAAIQISSIGFGSKMLKTVYFYNTGSMADWVAAGSGTASDSIDSNGIPGQYTVVPQGWAGKAGLQHQIPSMQAFIVMAQADDPNATIWIPYSNAGTIVPDSVRLRVKGVQQTTTAAEDIWTKIDVKGTRYKDRMWIFTDPNCSHSFDNGWDGEKFYGSLESPQIYAIEQDGMYQVNSVDNMNNTSVGFEVGEDTTYTLTFTHQGAQQRYRNIYLEDKATLKTIDITNSGSTYTFNAYPTDTLINRFKIVTNVDVATNVPVTNTVGNVLNIFSSQNTFFVDNKSGDTGTLQVFDIAGKMLRQYPFAAGTVTTIPTGFSSGSYVAKAFTKTERITRQLILH